jgi:hypothetical protein
MADQGRAFCAAFLRARILLASTLLVQPEKKNGGQIKPKVFAYTKAAIELFHNSFSATSKYVFGRLSKIRTSGIATARSHCA